MVNDQDLFDLFHRKLREMWFSEKKIHNSLPKMANAAQSDALRAAFKKHEAETQRQIARLVPLHSDYDSLVWGSRTEAGSG